MTDPTNSYENTSNRDSAEPNTKYTICYYMGGELRQITIAACSPFAALKVFKELHAIVYKNSLIEKIV